MHHDDQSDASQLPKLFPAHCKTLAGEKKIYVHGSHCDEGAEPHELPGIRGNVATEDRRESPDKNNHVKKQEMLIEISDHK